MQFKAQAIYLVNYVDIFSNLQYVHLLRQRFYL